MENLAGIKYAYHLLEKAVNLNISVLTNIIVTGMGPGLCYMPSIAAMRISKYEERAT